jgi:hypothetical protein
LFNHFGGGSSGIGARICFGKSQIGTIISLLSALLLSLYLIQQDGPGLQVETSGCKMLLSASKCFQRRGRLCILVFWMGNLLAVMAQASQQLALAYGSVHISVFENDIPCQEHAMPRIHSVSYMTTEAVSPHRTAPRDLVLHWRLDGAVSDGQKCRIPAMPSQRSGRPAFGRG